jgi:hypothetical protein
MNYYIGKYVEIMGDDFNCVGRSLDVDDKYLYILSYVPLGKPYEDYLEKIPLISILKITLLNSKDGWEHSKKTGDA